MLQPTSKHAGKAVVLTDFFGSCAFFHPGAHSTYCTYASFRASLGSVRMFEVWSFTWFAVAFWPEGGVQ